MTRTSTFLIATIWAAASSWGQSPRPLLIDVASLRYQSTEVTASDGEDYGLRYGYCFPLNSTQWTQVTVAWSDLMPELAGPLVDADGGYPPNRFRNVWFGKWFYWREYPACSYVIERMELVEKIDRDAAGDATRKPGLPRVLAKLKAGQPMTVVTMGDSLSDKRHWANREMLWSEILVKRLEDAYGSKVTLVNPAIGGTTLSQNVVLIPRWLQETLHLGQGGHALIAQTVFQVIQTGGLADLDTSVEGEGKKN